MAERIYGEFQTAGFPVATTGKSNVNNSGTNAYAQAVVSINADGAAVGPSDTFYTAQQTATSSAVALAAQALVNGARVVALSTNVVPVYVGPAGVTSATGFPLAAGDYIDINVTDTSAIYIIAPTGSPVVGVIGN